MIKAQDLRCGNLVTSKEWKGMHPVSGVEKTEYGFKILVKGFWHEKIEGKYFDLEPIELTPDILLKAGFLQSKAIFGKQEIKFDDFRLGYIGLGEVGGDTQYQLFINGKYLLVFIKYVHQLQNLIFSLTGEELNITL